MYTPFGSNLPLSGSPYYSRVNSNYSSGVIKNHYIVGFNPGYALQASELNEIQEQFYLNQNLTQRMNHQWMSYITGGYRIPFWEGAIPYAPNCVLISDPVLLDNQVTFNVLFKNTWYYWTDAASLMSFWVHTNLSNLDSDGFYVKQFAVDLDTTEYIGFTGTTENLICCQDSTCEEERQQLRDNSQGDTNTYNTCGASRKKISILDADIKTTSNVTSTFYPVISVTTGASIVDTVFTFMDGQALSSNSPS